MTVRGRITVAVLAATGGLLAWEGSGREVGAAAAPSALAAALPEPPSRLAPAAVLATLPPPARLGPGSVPETVDTGPLREWVEAPGADGRTRERYEVEYTLDPGLVARVAAILRRGRVALGHVVALDPATGRVLAYASTDPDHFPAQRTYPTASLVKVVTAAATLEHAPGWAERPCRYRGSPYRLTRARLDPPRSGRTASLRRALATSNNQCFAQLAVHALGPERMLAALERFGLLDSPAPAHPAGRVEALEDAFDLGRLGSGLAGSRITPLAAARLAATLATGIAVEPRWIARVRDRQGRTLALPPAAPARRAISPELAARLREMLVATTERGTARRAFRGRRGRPLLAPIRVAGKTGSITDHDPDGRYEWFIGVAPADRPRIAVATLIVHGDLWWRNASQIAAEVLRAALCEGGRCPAPGVQG